jgi:hypothetical protein
MTSTITFNSSTDNSSSPTGTLPLSQQAIGISSIFNPIYSGTTTTTVQGTSYPYSPITTTVPFIPSTGYTYTPTWGTDPAIGVLKDEMKSIKKMLGLILEGDENPEFLEKYKNLKKAYDEYLFFRDLILSEEDKKASKI